MAVPTFANYVTLLFTLCERFAQSQSTRPHRGRPVLSGYLVGLKATAGPPSARRKVFLSTPWLHPLRTLAKETLGTIVEMLTAPVVIQRLSHPEEMVLGCVPFPWRSLRHLK